MEQKREVVQYIKSLILLLTIFLCITGCGGVSDGEYTASVVLKGGSGKAYIESPCRVTVRDGKAVATLIWSSSNYDYMVVDGQTFYPVSTEGGSVFEVPVVLGKEFAVQADTTAMSKPHLIEYTLLLTIGGGDGAEETAAADNQAESSDVTKNPSNGAALQPPAIPGLTYISTGENAYAQCYRIHRYSDEYVVISVDDGSNYLLIPEGGEIPQVSSDITVLMRPLDSVYMAASSVMCHFDSLGSVGDIALSGTMQDDWYIDSAKEAMESGTLTYGGKYSAPDYEQIVMKDVDLAIENTMILHVPKVREKLEQLGIPVFIDRSSYEQEPLGRCEWVKVYGVIAGKDEAASEIFSEQEQHVESLDLSDVSGKNVAIFSINSNHQIVTRRSGDYFAKMVGMAGGTYLAPKGDDDSAASQVTISVEAFYDYAQNADILIYNATIQDAPETLTQLVEEDAVFGDFRAVLSGNVWYTDKSLYQLSDSTGTIIRDLYSVINEEKEETEFFHKLKR